MKQEHFGKWLACASIAALLGGCASLRTPYQRPRVEVPAAWRHGDGEPLRPAATEADWWKALGDERLDRLVALVLQRNNDLAAAALAIESARAQQGLAVINPTVQGTESSTTSRALKGGALPVQGGLPVLATSHTANFNVSYEVDLFGALAAQKEVARWETRATVQDLAALRVSLVGQAVDLYFQIGALNHRIELGDESLAYARRTLTLVEAQKRAGMASDLEVAEASSAAETQGASLDDLVRQREEARTSLSLLAGGARIDPGLEPPRLAETPPPDPGSDLPVQVLARRPDVRAAELRLREQLASADQTRLSFYPTFSLTGSASGQSTTLAQLASNPVGTLGAAVALPFLQIDEARLQTRKSKIEYRQAAAKFRQTLLSALADVETALADEDQFSRQGVHTERALAEARRAETLSEARYRAGSVPLKTWLDAQETRRQAEAAAVELRLSRLRNYVALVKSLGIASDDA